MKLNEQINRMRQMMGLINEIEIPLTPEPGQGELDVNTGNPIQSNTPQGQPQGGQTTGNQVQGQPQGQPQGGQASGNQVQGQPQGGQTTQSTAKLTDRNSVKQFQDWLDANKPGWAQGYKDGKVNKGKGYGVYGPRTKKAWLSYKDEYSKSQSTSTPPSQGNTPQTPGGNIPAAPTATTSAGSYVDPSTGY